jgi:hypothetical protein
VTFEPGSGGSLEVEHLDLFGACSTVLIDANRSFSPATGGVTPGGPDRPRRGRLDDHVADTCQW